MEPHGFAWVEISGYEGRNIIVESDIAKILLDCGIGCNCHRRFGVWNPGNFSCQNLYTLEVGANIFAKELTKIGFKIQVCTRLD